MNFERISLKYCIRILLKHIGIYMFVNFLVVIAFVATTMDVIKIFLDPIGTIVAIIIMSICAIIINIIFYSIFIIIIKIFKIRNLALYSIFGGLTSFQIYLFTQFSTFPDQLIFLGLLGGFLYGIFDKRYVIKINK